MPSETSLDGQINQLKTADPATLQRRWKTISRKAYPAHLPRSLIIQLIAYGLQASTLGDLEPDESRYLKNIGQGASAGAKVERFGQTKAEHSPGTVFVREHAGIMHQVVKTVRGFEWDGREFQSLSAVAHAITGTKWNGLKFFGVVSKAGRNARA